MTTVRLLQALVIVAVGGLSDGDRGALYALVVVTGLFLLALLWQLPVLERLRTRADGDLDRSSGYPAFDTLYAGIVVAAGSARSADQALVPALRRIIAGQVDEVGPQAVRERLGETWWALLAPGRPISSNSSGGGLTARDLDDLLTRLEHLR